MIENTNTKQFYPGPILNDTLEISEFLFNTAEQIKIKHSKLDENGVLRDVDLIYGQDYEVLKDEALTCDDGSEPPSHAHIMEMGLTASTGQITLKEHIHVVAGERLTAYRESAIIQDKNYPRTGAFPAATHEGALDYLTMQNQEQQDELDRALKVPISTQNFAGSMPLPIPGRALKINQDGSGFEMSEFDPDIALTTTENFRNESQQYAKDAQQSALNSENSAQISANSAQTAINYLSQINLRGDQIIKDADAIIKRVGLNMFDTVIKDHVLSYEESQGLALQGTWVYCDAKAGERHGYPDFYNRCVEERNEARSSGGVQHITLGKTTIAMFIHTNGHMYYDISIKDTIDSWFNTFGHAWFYGVDTANKRIFLPRNLRFEQMTDSVSQVGLSVEAGLPTHTHTRGTMNITGYVSNIAYPGTGAFTNRTDGGMGYGPTDKVANNKTWFDASRSWTGSTSAPNNAIYGKSNTVQPAAVKKLLYICVGNQVQDTSWVDVVTQVTNGVKDIEDKRVQSLTDLNNKTNTGISALANASNALRETQITNCIKEAPRRFNYKMENGTLTLYKGSVFIVPYGTTDLTSSYPKGATFIHSLFKVYDTSYNSSTKRFTVWVELTQDYSFSYASTSLNEQMLFIRMTSSPCYTISPNNCYSGDADTQASNTYHAFFDTANYKINMHNADGLINQVFALPCMILKGNGTQLYYYAVQTFQHIGYMGSCIWVDKGVKGYAANGKNIDDTYNNSLITTSTLVLYTTSTGSTPFVLGCNATNIVFNAVDFYEQANLPPLEGNWLWLNTAENKAYQYNSASGLVERPAAFVIGRFHRTSGRIDYFDPIQPFRAVDCNNVLLKNDKKQITSWGAPSSKGTTYTIGASGTQYTAPAEGYFKITWHPTGSGGWVGMQRNGVNVMVTRSPNTNKNWWEVQEVRFRQGDILTLNYAVSTITQVLFIYAEGSS